MGSTDRDGRVDPACGGDFPEESQPRDGSMREEIIRMAIEALQVQGYPDIGIDSINRDPRHRQAFIELLGYARPMAVVRRIIEDARAGRLGLDG
jgi:hypothetical protein